MRIAVVSDVHGNLTALEAVIVSIRREAPDLVVHGGDLALSGARPAEVIDRIRELGWPGVVGNTDELLWRPEERERQLERMPKLAPLLRLLFDVYAPHTRELLGEERIPWLRGFPQQCVFGDLALVHARPGDLWQAPRADACDSELVEAYGGLGAAVVAFGHIHRPFVRRLDGLTVANAGSVGSPWDGDRRAGYLLLDEGVLTIVRVEYDVETEVKALRAASHPDVGRLTEMLRRGRFVRPRVGE